MLSAFQTLCPGAFPQESNYQERQPKRGKLLAARIGSPAASSRDLNDRGHIPVDRRGGFWQTSASQPTVSVSSPFSALRYVAPQR